MTTETSGMPTSSSLSDMVRREGVAPSVFRETMSHYASGITVIAGHDGTEPLGFTCQSFYSVSLEPPLVSFSVMRSSTTYPSIRRTGRFSVNVLAGSQDRVSNQFARRGTDKWAGIDWEMSLNQNPIISGSLMWLDCSIHAEYEAGDHYVVIGLVNQTSPVDWHHGEPLVYFKGRYRHLGELDSMSP